MAQRGDATTTKPKSSSSKKKLMEFAGVWKDIDADDLIDRILEARHASPPSPSPRK